MPAGGAKHLRSAKLHADFSILVQSKVIHVCTLGGRAWERGYVLVMSSLEFHEDQFLVHYCFSFTLMTSPNSISKRKITLYADDMLICKPICSDTSYVELQQDINLLSQWSEENMLSFNTAKYKCMLLTKKAKCLLYPAILLNNDPLEYVQQYKYLGVIVSHCWSQHIQEVCNKARKVLGIIYRNISSHTNDASNIFRLYIALV